MRSVMLLWSTLLLGTTIASDPMIGYASSDPITFAVFSDIHVQSWDKQAIGKFGRALDDLQKIAPQADALVINGDLGNGFMEDYRTLSQVLGRHPHPGQICYTIGNHEFYKAWHAGFRWSKATFPNGETEEASISRFLKLTGEPKVYYERRINGYRFLFLGSEHYRQFDPDYEEDAVLSQEQLEWLGRKLEESVAEDKPVFVFLHQPLPDTVSGSGKEGSGRGVVQHKELKALLSHFPQAIYFSGHSHRELSQPRTMVQDGFTMVNSSSVSQPLKTGEESPEPKMAKRSEGLIVEVHPGFVWIRGRDFWNGEWVREADYKIKIGKPSNSPS